MNASKDSRLPTPQDGRRSEVSSELEIVLHDVCSIIVEGRMMMLLPGQAGGRGSDGEFASRVSDI